MFRLAPALALALLAPTSTAAGPGDARDTLTACLAVQPNPAGLHDLFLSQGWVPVGADPDPVVQERLAMAMSVEVATQDLDHTSPQSDWDAFHAAISGWADRMLADTGPWDATGGLSILSDPVTGNVLIVSVQIDPDRGRTVIVCTFAATATALALPDFSPGPNLPFRPGGFASENPRPNSILSRALVNTLIIVPDPDIVEDRLGFRPDVAAVFWTNLQYNLQLVMP